MNPPTILNHDNSHIDTSNNLWNPNMLVVIPIGALLERNGFPTQFGGDIWKPTAICNSVIRPSAGVPTLSRETASYHNQPSNFPRTNNMSRGKVDCGCRCPHKAEAHSHLETSATKDRPVLNLSNILEASGVIETVKKATRSTRSSSSMPRQHDVADRKRLNLFTSLKLEVGEHDCEDDESDADSLLSSISKEISKFDGDQNVNMGQLSPPVDVSASVKIYSQRSTVPCTPQLMSEDRYSINSGDNSPWNLPN